MDEQYQELLRCIESLDARETIQELGGDVLDRIRKRFVLDNPRVWWLSFRFPPKEHHYDDDQYKRISCFLNNEDFCYFGLRVKYTPEIGFNLLKFIPL